MTTSPTTAIVLGTGLGKLANEITDATRISYKEIPNFPVSTVEGHSGNLIFGKLGDKDILAMEGDFITMKATPCKRSLFPFVSCMSWVSKHCSSAMLQAAPTPSLKLVI